jgi:polysaccharide export outer membrane protein
MKKLLTVLATLLLLGTSVAASAAQSSPDWDAGRPQLTRAELTELLERLDNLTGSTAYSSALRSQARDEAVMVRNRLERGDIRVGDQIQLTVEGETELTNTFAVRPGEILTLPGVGDVPVGGVLRSELEQHLTSHLAKFIRTPVVHAQSLVRVTITGGVATPGFYAVQAERLLSDAIMDAGGPALAADLNSIYIERDGQKIWSGRYLQQAMTDGRTLDQLSLQAGDQIVVPMQRPGASSLVMRAGLGLLSTAALVVTIMSQIN